MEEEYGCSYEDLSFCVDTAIGGGWTSADYGNEAINGTAVPEVRVSPSASGLRVNSQIG